MLFISTMDLFLDDSIDLQPLASRGYACCFLIAVIASC
ncbi:conserved hypothetical protein [delta proteobacterium NaphS2]|nr:conserved hypothetical protein [delta proteobacterium NaphS2]